MWITHEHLYTIYLKEKKNRCSRHFAIVRILFFSDVLCNTVDKLAVFSQQVSHDSDAPVCSDRESVFASVDLFPFFFSSRFPPTLFFLLFHRHRPHACIFFFHAVRRPSSSSSRFLTSNAHTEEPKPCTWWLIYTVILCYLGAFPYSRIQVKVSDEIKLGFFFRRSLKYARLRHAYE